MRPRFPLDWVEIPLLRRRRVGPLTVTAFPAAHAGETHPTCVRVEVADKVVAYTGDSAWTKHMPEVARDADLFISECYCYARSVRLHMNWPDIEAHRDELAPKRMVLTHFSREMLPHRDDVSEETAYDGMVVEL